MHHLEGLDVYVAYLYRLMWLYRVKDKIGHTRIFILPLLGKTIGQHLFHPLHRLGISIDIHWSQFAIGAHIVHTAHMIIMGVGNKDSIYLSEIHGHHLLSEVRSTVDEHPCICCLQHCRGTQSFVAWVFALTHGTLTPQHGNTTTGTCSKKSKLHHSMLTSG